MAGVLAAVCGQATAAPISLPPQLELAEEAQLPAEKIGLMVLIEPSDLVETELGITAEPGDEKATNEKVPEPSTGPMLTIELFLAGSFWVLHRQMRKQGHRPFRRRVRRIWQLMA